MPMKYAFVEASNEQKHIISEKPKIISVALLLKKKVRMTRKCHNPTLQTNPRYHEEES